MAAAEIDYMPIDVARSSIPSHTVFVEEHIAGQIGELTVILGEYGEAENGAPKWAVVIRHPDRDDICMITGVFDMENGDYDSFRKNMCDHALNVRESLYYASQNVADLSTKKRVLHS